MKFPRLSNFPDALAAGLCLLCAIGLQIQITLFSSPTYIGLRVNATDILVPAAGLAILVTLLRRKSLWPEWKMKHVYLWLAGITLILTLALFNSWLSYGEINRWAITNKFGGWIILMAIMGMGAWIGTNARREHIALFIQTFLYTALAVLFYELLVIVLRSFETTAAWFKPDPYAFYPIDGFMANRNAYGLLILSIFSFSTLAYFLKHPIIKSAYCYTLYFLLPLFLVFNGSRATLLALAVIAPAIFILNRNQIRKCLYLILCIVLGTIFTLCVYANKPDKLIILTRNQLEVIAEATKVTAAPAEAPTSTPALVEIGENVTYPGDSMRLTILQDALEMISQHPVIGSGLGSMLIYQQQKHGEVINVIDSTPVWILVEMGVIGLAVFTLFYWRVVKTFWTARKTDDEFIRMFYTALLFVVLGFTFMCLFHEIMYTRHMWFLIGLGLALKMRQNEYAA